MVAVTGDFLRLSGEMRLLVLLVAVCAGMASAKVFSKCELAKELETVHHMKRDDVKNWVCIAQYESTFNTRAINHANWDGSKDYGLFQLNNKYWCGSDHGKNVCQMPCSDLLDDDLTDDLRCIKTIIRDTERWKGKGTALTAWVAYVKKCANKDLDQYMAECWRDATSPNIVGMIHESTGIRNTQPNMPGPEGHMPIINNARVPIRPKVISNMHPPYARFPMQPPFVVSRPYSYFYHRNY